MGVRGGLRALSFHVTPPPGLSVGSLLTNCQPALLGNSVPLPTLFLLQRSSHLSWSTRRRSRASSPDTPISPFRCLVLMAATTNCSADAKLAEGIDLRGVQGQPDSVFGAQQTTFRGSVPLQPCPPPLTPAPSVSDGARLLPGKPLECCISSRPHRPCRLIFSSCQCFQLAWEQCCVAEPAGRPATSIPMWP